MRLNIALASQPLVHHSAHTHFVATERLYDKNTVPAT